MQVKWITRLDAMGYATCVAHSLEEAKKFISDFLK